MSNPYEKPWLDRWLDKRSRNASSRFFSRFIAAFLATFLTGMILPAFLFMTVIESTFSNTGETMEIIMIMAICTLIVSVPTVIYALICAGISGRLKMLPSILSSIMVASAIWLLSSVIMFSGTGFDVSFLIWYGLVIVSGCLGIAAARGIELLLQKRMAHNALMAEIEAEAQKA